MKSVILFFTLGLLSLFVNSCNDPLPTYTPPTNVLSADVLPLNAIKDTVRYSMLDNNNPNLVKITLNSAFYGYEIKIVNMYEETIQDYFEVEGTLELSWKEKPELKSVIPITATSFYSGVLDPTSNLLTINPGDTVKLRVYWNFKLTTEDWAFTQVKSTDSPVYSGGAFNFYFYRTHEPMLLTAKLKVKIFRGLSFVEKQSIDDFPVVFQGKVTMPP